MKIGIDARPLISKQPSGIGIYLIQILRQIVKNGINDSFFLYSNEPLLYHNEILNSFVVRIIPRKVGTIWLCYELKEVLLNDGIDVFWGTQHILPLNVPSIKKIVTVHDLALLIHPKWGSYKNAFMQNIFTRKSCKVADKLLADSSATALDINKMLGISSRKIAVVPLGFSKEHTDITENEKSLIENKYRDLDNNYFLFVGTIEPRKNITNMVRAFEKYSNNYDSGVHLVLAGGLGWKYKPILKYINKSKFKERIHLLGYVSEAEKKHLYEKANAFLFPSNYEGFGIPILEAMAYGLPVITTQISSLPEVGGQWAFYVNDPADYSQIAKIMGIVSTLSRDERTQLAQQELAWVKRFDWKMCAERTVLEIELL